MSAIISKSAAILRNSILLRPCLLNECRSIATTNPLFAQPPKKKKRLDPAILRLRVERKIKKYEREVARLEREPRQFIPILEYEYDEERFKELKERPGRNIEELGVSEASFKAAHKLWTIYRSEQSNIERKSLQKVERAQAHALKILKQLDEELYNRTLEADDVTLIPHISSHTRRETPPNPKYTPPDGYIKDITKEWIK